MKIRRHDRRHHDRLGFTLMEVMVVVVILVILAGTAGVFVFRYIEDAKVDRAKADCKTIEGACMAYKMKYGDFPETLQELVTPSQGGKPFLDSPDAIIDPWGNQYVYSAQGQNSNGLKPDISTTSPDGEQIGNWMSHRK